MGVNEDLKVVVYATGDYRAILNDILISSLRTNHPTFQQENFIAVVKPQNTDLAGNTNNQTYKELMRERINFYRDKVYEYKGKRVLFLDCDVIFVDSCLEEINEILNTCDFAMQQNYIAGIWGVNCNERSCNFFDEFVECINEIELGSRQDGYPQFELGNLINKYCNEDKLTALELPPQYGFLVPEMKIYHAINGGINCASKALILMISAVLYDIMSSKNFDVFDDGTLGPSHMGEKEDFFAPPMQNTINWFACFKTEDMPLVYEEINKGDGSADWTLAHKWAINLDDMFKTMNTTSIRLLVGASWCDLRRTPRFFLDVDKHSWFQWLGYSSD
tara:strand:+ start:5467 stop:6465 length:999 start_codon:yes stop_codon:yes gene_type:complete